MTKNIFEELTPPSHQEKVKEFIKKLEKIRCCCIFNQPTRYIKYDTGDTGKKIYRELLFCDEHYELKRFPNDDVKIMDIREFFKDSDLTSKIRSKIISNENMCTIQIPESIIHEIEEFEKDAIQEFDPPKIKTNLDKSTLLCMAWWYFHNEIKKSWP